MRILLIDGETDTMLHLKRNLEASCFVVDTADDGYRGSQMARTIDYDLVILEQSIPLKDGLTVCKEIRQSHRSFPILLLSKCTDTQKKIELLNAGADDYLTKPFFLEELLAHMRALLRRPRELAEDILCVGDLTLDIQKQQVTKSGKYVYLTKKEFALLEYFMKHEGMVLSRHTLMEHVWDMNGDEASNTIGTHILSLRKKLCRGMKLISTIPGRGYMMSGRK